MTHLTLAPLNSWVKLGHVDQWDFGHGLRLSTPPAWLTNEFLGALSDRDRDEIRQSNLVLTVEHEKDDHAAGTWLFHILELAIWLITPGAFGVTHLCHVETANGNNAAWRGFRKLSRPASQSDDTNNPITPNLLKEATPVFERLADVSRNSSTEFAARTLILMLRISEREFRYVLLWFALEALFGPENSGEISHQLAERIAKLMGDDADSAYNLYRKVKKSYTLRSKIVHGMRIDTKKGLPLAELQMLEGLVRKAMVRILTNDELYRTFGCASREEYLRRLPFS